MLDNRISNDLLYLYVNPITDERSIMMESGYDDAKHNKFNRHLAIPKATEAAKDRMKREGIEYPLFKSNIDPSDYLALLDAYARVEGQYIREALTPPVQSRPLVMDNVVPKNQWGRAYYD
jgi:hypothetical protein